MTYDTDSLMRLRRAESGVSYDYLVISIFEERGTEIRRVDTMITIILTKTTVAQIEVVPSYHRVRGLHFLAVIYAETIYIK